MLPVNDKNTSEPIESSGAAVIDRVALRERFLNRDDFIKKIARIALSSLDKYSVILQQAEKDKNIEQVTFSTHTLKGISGNISATIVEDCAAEIEALSRDNDPLAYEKVPYLFSLLKQLKNEIKEILNT